MKLWLYSALLLFVFACQTTMEVENATNSVINPAAEGFNLAASDTKAIEIADQVMEAMGGYENWESTRYINWTFFGKRDLFWDKKTGEVQVKYDSSTVYINIHKDSTGIAYFDGVKVSEDEELQAYLKRAKSTWINDAYWLVMPFKLKDSGVTLKYNGADTISTGEAAEVLQLTFEQVGDTPQNKYLVYVTPSDSLVKQWDFYRNATDSLPGFTTPWIDYKVHGNILLSGNRGRSQLSNIAVYDELPADFEWLKD